MSSVQNQALPVGHVLQEYTIQKVLNSGGFSYVYVALDQRQNKVAIKEYLPTGLAVRTNGVNVTINNPEAAASFKHGLKCFFEEGRTLANIDHRNIVRVLNFFRANETVYMVMQYERGKSLQESILKQQKTVSEVFIRRLFGQLLNGLREVHAQKLLHLDIKPSNIYIRLDGSPVLLDFGSARQTLSGSQPNLPPSYTPGFASPEQYFDKQLLGPWSDIYSVGATMYACIARAAPISADKRSLKDMLVPASQLGKHHYSKHLLEMIDSCLALNHMERPQSVFELQRELVRDFNLKPEKLSVFKKIHAYLNKPL